MWSKKQYTLAIASGVLVALAGGLVAQVPVIGGLGAAGVSGVATAAAVLIAAKIAGGAAS